MSAAPSVDPAGQVAPAPPVLGADAAQVLFERHAGAIYGYCLNRLGRREEAEDAVQTTFLNAFRALRRGVVPEFEAAWLYKIAENVCSERHRSAGRRLEVVQDPTVLEEAAPAAESRSDELAGLGEALGRMAPRQRQALLLREWKGLSYREIAQELRLSPAAVETLLFRARRSLARNLQVGSLLPWLKSLLGGSAAAKTAAAASVVVASASLGGGGPVEPSTRPAAKQRAAKVEVAKTTTASTPRGRVVAPAVLQTSGRSRPALRGDAPVGRPAPGRTSLPGGPLTTPVPAMSEPAPAEADTNQPAPPASPAAPTAPPAPASSPPAAPAPTPPPVSLPTQAPPPLLPELPALPPLLPQAPQLPTSELPALPELPPLTPLPPLQPLPPLPPLLP
jgi:RNA polymerase sigma factor (sigma-70 family)